MRKLKNYQHKISLSKKGDAVMLKLKAQKEVSAISDAVITIAFAFVTLAAVISRMLLRQPQDPMEKEARKHI